MKWKFQTAGRLLALLALSGALLAAPLPAQAAPGVLTGLTGTGSKLELELTESILIDGSEVNITSMARALKAGIAYLSEDRKRYGIIPVRDCKENISLSSLEKVRNIFGLDHRKERQRATEISKRMNVKTPSLETLISSLSGGNQQKIVIAKWLLCSPEILLLDEPTRGIDVGAKFEIYKLITELAKEGKAVLMISSEMEELIGVCDRIYVMAKGRISGELARKDFSQENIMKLALRG